MNTDNLYSARFATFFDLGTIAIPKEDVKYITALDNSKEVIILVFRAFGNYKAWLKEHGFNDKLNSFKCFYNLVISCDWKVEQDKNVATAKNLIDFHLEHTIHYTKMVNVFK